MPKIRKTILPRVKKSLRERGVLRTAWRCLLGPYYVVKSYRSANKNFNRASVQDEFDLRYGVETSTRVHPTDLEIDGPNWIDAAGYWPTAPEFIHEALSALPIRFEDFIFIDFGSGKGRVLLQASEKPFQKVIGVEFSSELHDIALKNIRQYKSETQSCRDVQSLCMDFTQFVIPVEPLVAYLYNPASERVIAKLAQNIAQSLAENPRELWVIYMTPAYDVFASDQLLRLRKVKATAKYSVFTNSDKRPVAAAA